MHRRVFHQATGDLIDAVSGFVQAAPLGHEGQARFVNLNKIRAGQTQSLDLLTQHHDDIVHQWFHARVMRFGQDIGGKCQGSGKGDFDVPSRYQAGQVFVFLN